jgi:hypothetical protein
MPTAILAVLLVLSVAGNIAQRVRFREVNASYKCLSTWVATKVVVVRDRVPGGGTTR